MMPGSYIPSNYLPILITLILATCFAVGILALGEVLRPRRPYGEKLSIYESGNVPVGEPRRRFTVRFYVIGMLFVVFDVEAVFLYPWAVSFGNIGLLGFWSMLFFLAIILVGYLNDWKKGALD
ncbi:MAG TPA: NADH-quinone oxidoreductase subunit A [Dissulfurispiraceae bacterium]|nr:NADH-quinone oxidoreductase subunit A [Dissulfurispiraceae bacterium]